MKKNILILFLLIFSSCGNNTDVEKSFANKIDLIAEHIAIDELLNINNLVKTEDYIVLQNTTNSGHRLDETENSHSSVIEIYTWDGKPDRVLYLDSSVAYFAVDEKDGIIYAVNPDEDSILKFRLP